jgi:hypothetical protein
MRPEPFFLPGGVGFYRGLLAMALLVCGFFMFRETPLPQGFAQSDKVEPLALIQHEVTMTMTVMRRGD